MKLAFAVVAACLVLGCGGSTDSDASGSGATSGSGGTSGTGAVSGTGGIPSTGGVTGLAPECTTDSDCTLFTDCCTCTAYGPNEAPPPECLGECAKSACDIVGVSADSVQCVAGRCVAGIQCVPDQILCDGIPPECDIGEVPAVLGGCWGGCVPATECASVPSCNECDAPLTTCVTIHPSGGDGSSSQHCVDVPKGCEGSADCACMGTNVCVSPTSECMDLSGLPGMACGCAACD